MGQEGLGQEGMGQEGDEVEQHRERAVGDGVSDGDPLQPPAHRHEGEARRRVDRHHHHL